MLAQRLLSTKRLFLRIMQIYLAVGFISKHHLPQPPQSQIQHLFQIWRAMAGRYLLMLMRRHHCLSQMLSSIQTVLLALPVEAVRYIM